MAQASHSLSLRPVQYWPSIWSVLPLSPYYACGTEAGYGGRAASGTEIGYGGRGESRPQYWQSAL
eukprot:315090-Rhodomonas_salina.2